MRRRPSFKLSRDSLLFAMGALGIAYETLSGGAEKPTLIIIFGGMVGLPLFLRNDEARRNEHDNPPAPTPPPRPAEDEET